MKRINPRLAKKHRAYTVQELAEKLGVHKHTVRGWLKKGLPAISDAKPTLIHGAQFQEWWAKQRKVAKRPCKPGQMYCFKCRELTRPALGMVEYTATNAATGNLKAICETCDTMMHQRARLANLSARMPGLDIQITQAPSRIVERARPSSNCAKTEGA
ncbi:helix-turn-helix domain-containing protein [Altericroceibacterium endophyticum]|uniref:Helix-turn-helix domain-containing protein n=1 Tax=Altericroceibacterium endophyticum TaxID=1808508 RepID=A0A6I4T9Z3_9SPHN|nr:helix-turn-helix domain-containing protein [Altericroceibacterium endophyticum]MXO66585.1 helix-turn-helix domain-containing protein [Altericroceibacterium endophyticum]